MREALIVLTARTPLTKAYRGDCKRAAGPTLASCAVRGRGYPEATVGLFEIFPATETYDGPVIR